MAEVKGTYHVDTITKDPPVVVGGTTADATVKRLLLNADGSMDFGAGNLSEYVLTPTLQTITTYDDEDVYFDTEELGSDAARENGGLIKLKEITIFDAEQINADIELWFLNDNISIGTLGVSNGIDKTNYDKLTSVVRVSSGYYENSNIISIAKVPNENIGEHPAANSSSKSVYVAGVAKGGGRAYTNADAIRIRFVWEK